MSIHDGTVKLDDQEKRMFADLRRLALRHPGMVSGHITKLVLHQDQWSHAQFEAVRLEWLKLCPQTQEKK